MAWMSEYPLRNIPDAAESSILRRILERGGGKSVRLSSRIHSQAAVLVLFREMCSVCQIFRAYP